MSVSIVFADPSIVVEPTATIDPVALPPVRVIESAYDFGDAWDGAF